MIDVNRLALLRELERRGSIAAVARISGVSSSAVSQQLRKLEAEVGTRLLEQRGRGVGLTVAAQRLAGHAEAVLTILERAESELTSGRDRVHGTVRLTGFASFALRYLPALVARLEAAHPDLEVTFSQVEPVAALEAGAGRRADVAIVDEFPQLPRPVDAGVQRTHLLRDRMVPCLPAGSCADDSGEVAELERLRWVFEPEGTEAYAWAHRVCREAGFEPRVAFTTPDLRVHHELVRTGLAAAFLPRMLLAPGERDFGFAGAGVWGAGDGAPSSAAVPAAPQPCGAARPGSGQPGSGQPGSARPGSSEPGAGPAAPVVADAAGQVPLWRDVFAVARRSAATSRAVTTVVDGLRAIMAEPDAAA